MFIYITFVKKREAKEEYEEVERKLFDDSNAVFGVPPGINEWNRTNSKRTEKVGEKRRT